MTMINLFDFEKAAKKKLQKMFFDFYASGACDQITLNANREAYNRIYLKPRILTDNSERTLNTTLLGQSMPAPILIAPTAFHGLADNEAELATARAANSTKTIMILSTMSNTPLENISRANPDYAWFQLSILDNRDATKNLVRRAETAGYKALVLTVDAQVLGLREADSYNKFKLPDHLEAINLTRNPINGHPSNIDSEQFKIEASKQNLFDKKLTWKDVEWLRSFTKLPILIKGILHETDAKLSVDLGVDGIIVSNHGGRQLDTAIPAIHVLPSIAKIVKKKVPILIDGGIRRGTDILKAIALGADAVLIGRPILWGLATNSTLGVEKVLSILKHELDTAIALCGLTSIDEIKTHGSNLLSY